MKNKNIYLSIILAAAVICTVWYFAGRSSDNEIVASFTNESGESVLVTFDSEKRTAKLEGAGFEEVILSQAVSASGARYVNESESLELWNKGNQVTISKSGEAVFTGKTLEIAQEMEEPEEVEEVEVGLYVLSGPTWIWKRTELNDGRIIRPHKPGEFSVKFDQKNGRVVGNTDCNNFSSEYTAGVANTLSFGPFMSTLMFCEGSQETEFVRMVADSTQYTFTPSGDLVLMIKFDSGSAIFEKR